MKREADGLPTFFSSAGDNIAGTYQMGDKAELPTQLLGDDYFYEKGTQDMNHEEDPFGNPAEDFQETQLLDEYDDSGGRSTRSCYKWAGIRKLEVVNGDEEMDNNEVEPINKPVDHVNSDSSTEDECGEEDLYELSNQRGGNFSPSSVARPPPLQASIAGPQDIISSLLLVEQDKATRAEVGFALAPHKDTTTEEMKSQYSGGARAEANNINALERQEVKATRHSPTQVANNMVICPVAGDVTGRPKTPPKLPSLSFGSIGSIRGESMRAAAACPLTWKPSCDVAWLGYGSEKQEPCTSLGNALQRLEEGEIPVTKIMNDQTVLETDSTSVILPKRDVEDPQTHKPLKPEFSNLGNCNEMTLSDAVAITPNNHEGKPESSMVEERVTTSSPACVHEQLCIQEGSPEPNWILRTIDVDPSTLRVYERRIFVSKASSLPPGSKHQEKNMLEGVPVNNKNEIGEDDELGLERRARQLFPAIEAEKDKTKVHQAVYEEVATRPTSEKVEPTMEDNLPLVLTDNLDLQISPRSKLLESSSESMSYLDSQEPGEDVQARALNVVDKLVWLNNPEIPEIPVMPCFELDTLPPKGPSSTASNALAQVAGARLLRNPLGVYVWVDSQHDEAGPTFGGAKDIETFKVPAARSSLCSGTGTREGNKGGHKMLTDLGRQQREGMGKMAMFSQEMESSKSQRAQPLEPRPPKVVKERRASHGLRLVDKGKSQGGVDEIKSDFSSVQNKKRKVSQADRHLFEDKETSLHGMNNVEKEEEDGQSERLVKAVRPDAPLDVEALEIPGVEALGEDTRQFMQIATRCMRKKRPEASGKSDEPNMRLQKCTAGRRVSWGDDVVKDNLPLTTKRKLSQKTSGGVCDKGEENESDVSDNDTLDSLHKAMKRPKLETAGEENKRNRKRIYIGLERESEVPISAVMNQAQKQNRLLKTDNFEPIGFGNEDMFLVETSAKGVLTREKKQLMRKTQDPVTPSNGRRDQQIKKGCEATLTVNRPSKQDSPTEFKREGINTSLSAPITINAKTRSSGTGVENSAGEPEEVTTPVENPTPAVATHRMTQMSPLKTRASRTGVRRSPGEREGVTMLVENPAPAVAIHRIMQVTPRESRASRTAANSSAGEPEVVTFVENPSPAVANPKMAQVPTRETRALRTGGKNSPGEPEEVMTLVENPCLAVATPKMAHVTPHETTASKTSKKGQDIVKNLEDLTVTDISKYSKQNSQTVTEQDASRSAESIGGEQLIESKRKGKTASIVRPVVSVREVNVTRTGGGSHPGNVSEVRGFSGTLDGAINASSTVTQSQSTPIIMQLPNAPPSSEQGNLESVISLVQGDSSCSVAAERREDLWPEVITHEKGRQLQHTVEPSVDLSALTQSSRPPHSDGGANEIKRGRSGKKSDSIAPVQLTRRKEREDPGSSDHKKSILGALYSSTSSSPKSTPIDKPLTEGKRRRKKAGSVYVLFSHGLAEVTVKQQCKILARLGGHAVNTSRDCTHFVTEKFQRTGNMLEAMAAGKPVVTPTWLDSCAQANFFLDERKFYLQDGKKEKELGFSMYSTISAAKQRPLLQGCRVFITPNTNPKPPALMALVKAAGGEVEDNCKGLSLKVAGKNHCVVIADEKDYNICIPFLEQGAKVCRPELIFSGIPTHHLDYVKHQLFEDHVSRRRR